MRIVFDTAVKNKRGRKGKESYKLEISLALVGSECQYLMHIVAGNVMADVVLISLVYVLAKFCKTIALADKDCNFRGSLSIYNYFVLEYIHVYYPK